MRLTPQWSVKSLTVILSSGLWRSSSLSEASSARFVICDMGSPLSMGDITHNIYSTTRM